MTALNEAQMKRIAKARYTLYNLQPFFAQLTQYLRPQICEFVPTMAVDANSNLYINSKFLDMLDDKSLLWVLAHEAMHMVTMTCSRFPEGAQKSVFNIASDASINMLITDDAKIPMIDEKIAKPIYGPEWEKYRGATTEAIYYDLMVNFEQQVGMTLEDFLKQNDGEGGDQDGNGEGGSTGGVKKGKLKGKWWDDSGARLGKKGNSKGMDENGNSVSDGGMTEEQKAQWKARAASAAAAAKSVGKLSGPLEQYMTQILESKKDWRSELRHIANTALRSRWTWKIPGRRTAGKVRTPGKERGVPTAICYIDTSGSQSDADIQRCLSETAKIFQLCGGKGHLILGDSEIYFSGDMDAKNLSHLPEVRRGGTDFTVIFDHIKENFKKDPAILVGFTDCCGPFPENPPAFPVIWCVPVSKNGYHAEAPWGRLIEVEV